MTEQVEREFDLIDDIIFFINNDPEFYRTTYFPLVSKFTDELKKNRVPSADAFKSVSEKAYDAYKAKFKVKDLPDNLSPDELKDTCIKLHTQEVKHFKESSVSEDIDQLKKLAGITNTVLSPVPVLNKGAVMREQNIKPGTKEWFNLWFPLDDSRFPAPFRGRKK